MSLSSQLALLAGGGSAISSEADVISNAATKVLESTERSMALFGEKAVAISQLATIATECAKAGWNGEDAVGINPIAVDLAERFIRALPEHLPLPQFAPDPDGAISLDWIQSRNRLLSLSIGNTNRLAFAWLEDTDKGHGVANFDGRNSPPRILDAIKDITHVGFQAA